MPEQKLFKVGDRIVVNDLNNLPEGSWLIKETMQFARAKSGHSILSLTPVEGATIPVETCPDNFTAVYAGHITEQKQSAITQALNAL